MPCMEWNSCYNLGISRLDEQHRRLIAMLNTTYDCCLDDDWEDSVERTVEELDVYARSHFSAEEQLMKNSDYPARQMHVEEHDLFIRQVAQLRQDLFDGNGLLAMEMLTFLGTWLVAHILDADGKLYTHLIAKKVF